jgi:hypothetical protein
MKTLFINFSLLKIHIIEIINDLNEQVFRYANNNNNAKQLLNKCNKIFLLRLF